MATSFIFDGKKIKIPGVYSTIKSGIKNPPLASDFGNLLIIDTGQGANWGGGSGVGGELEQGKDSIYNFDNVSDFRNFVKGGLLWDIAEKLFRPGSLGTPGVSSISIIRAADTVPAKINYSFTGGGTAGGTLEVTLRNEGLVGNGAVNADDNLIKGFGAKMSSGRIDPDKFILQFFKTGFKGLDSDGDSFDFISADNSKPELLVSSPEFDNVQQFIDWMSSDFDFNQEFKLTASTVTGTGVIDTADLTGNLTFNLASGGTESYTTPALDLALDAVTDLPVDFVLAPDYGDDAQSSINVRILAWIAEDAVIKPDFYVGGGVDRTKFTQVNGSIPTSEFYNSQYASVVHGGLKVNTPLGVKVRPAIYHAAQILGREAGLAPQVPITFKNLRVDGVVHSLNDKEVTQGLDAGILMTRLEGSSFDIVKGINTLQRNDFLINEDGTTSSKQIRRVSRQINKELLSNVKRALLKQTDGVNRNTLSAEDVKAYVEGYLKSITANSVTDNLILGFQNVVVELVGDAYKVNYEIITNREISFVLLTGFIVE